MKTKILILLSIVFISLKTKGQSSDQSITNNTYAIIQVTAPQTVFGEYEIKISYGNGKVENFKKVDYSRKNTTDLINETTNALNYMSEKGYVLRQTLTYAIPTANIQYIFEKKVLAKVD